MGRGFVITLPKVLLPIEYNITCDSFLSSIFCAIRDTDSKSCSAFILLAPVLSTRAVTENQHGDSCDLMRMTVGLITNFTERSDLLNSRFFCT